MHASSPAFISSPAISYSLTHSSPCPPHPLSRILSTMAGHSHWANIAHKKGLIDAKRGKLWSKLAKGIMVAAKAGGGDPESEPAPALRHHRRQSRQHAERHHRPGHQERHRRFGRRELRGNPLRRLRPERRRNPVRYPHRQPQPHGRRSSQDLRTGRRQSRRHGLRRLDVRPQRACSRFRPIKRTKKRSWTSRSKPAPTMSATKATNFDVTCDPDVYSNVCDAIDAAGLKTEVRQITRIPKDTVDLDRRRGARRSQTDGRARRPRRRAKRVGQLQYSGRSPGRPRVGARLSS